MPVFDVYTRVFNSIGEIDPFAVMDLYGIDDKLRCLDLIQYARGKVLAKGNP